MVRGNKMKQFIIGLILVVNCVVISKSGYHVSAAEKITVGFYEDVPFSYLDENGEVTGYFHELMTLIAQQGNLDYEYEYLSTTECLEKLKNKEIDLMLGVGKTFERETYYLYSDLNIGTAENNVYTNFNSNFGELEQLEGKTLGYVKGSMNEQIFLELLEEHDVTVQLKEMTSKASLHQLFEQKEIDIMISTPFDYKLKDFDIIYHYSSGPMYVVTYKGNDELMKRYNESFFKIMNDESNSLSKLHDKYFTFNLNNDFPVKLAGLISVIGSLIIICFIMIKLKDKNVKNKNRKLYLDHLKNEEFVLFYQPIINLASKKVSGFEALIRLKKDEAYIPPYTFLKEVEELDLMYDITLWVFKTALKEVEKLGEFKEQMTPDCYISINISYKQLLNTNFIQDVMAIKTNYQESSFPICFELIERFPLDDVEKVKEVITKLKQHGIKIAMDDFGVEYSNFDLLEKLNYDIVKLDKIFVEDIDTSSVKKLTLQSVCYSMKNNNKKVVIEGVEAYEQLKVIQAFGHHFVNIQGYYYSKPLPIDELVKNTETIFKD